jgi:hypothetical protein
MSTLHDLRATLDQHADGVEDTERYIRPVAVRARIRAVRRRRAGTVAVAAVLMLLAGGAAVSSVRSAGTPEPASVAGVDVPRSIDVLGFPYRLSGLVDLSVDTTHVAPADRDRAVVLVATGLGDGIATLYSDDTPIARARPGEQVSVPVDLGDAGADLQVRFDDTDHHARAGVAVYEATGELAQGVTNADGTTVFRHEVAGNPLVQAAFSTPGAKEIRLEATAPAADMSYTFYCSGEPDLWVNVEVDGTGPLASSCGDVRPDAGVGTSAMTDGSHQVRDHDVRVYLTDGADGPEVTREDVEFGVGIYLRSSLDQQVAGQRVAARVEYLGRTWELAGVQDAPATIDSDGGDVLLGFAADGTNARASWAGRLLDREDGMVTLADGGYTSTAGLLLAGDAYDVRIDGDVTDARLLTYRPE